MTYTEFIEEIKTKAREELSYDSVDFFPEGYTSDDPHVLELILDSNKRYVGGDPSPWLKTDIMLLWDKSDEGIKSFQRVAIKKLYDDAVKQQPENAVEFAFDKIRGLRKDTASSSEAIKARSAYETVRPNLILRPLKYDEDELFDAVYDKVNDFVLALYQLLKAEVTDKTADSSRTTFISSKIKRSELKSWGVDREEVMKNALENTMRLFPPSVYNVKTGKSVNLLESKLKREDVMMSAFGMSSFILTTSVTTNGAIAIFYPGVIEKIMKILGGPFIAIFMNADDIMIFEKDSPFAAACAQVTHQAAFDKKDITHDIYICDKNGIRPKR